MTEKILKQKNNTVTLIQPVEKQTQIQKKIKIEMIPEKPTVRIDHKIKNKSHWPLELTPWGITVLNPGGEAIIPLTSENPENLLPDRTISFWPYSELNDERVCFREECIFIKQASDLKSTFKLGALVKDEWVAYINGGHAFIKQFNFEKEENYPDYKSNVEVFTDESMLELETLGPLKEIDRGETIEHSEKWKLVNKIPKIRNKQDISKHLLPKIS